MLNKHSARRLSRSHVLYLVLFTIYIGFSGEQSALVYSFDGARVALVDTFFFLTGLLTSLARDRCWVSRDGAEAVPGRGLRCGEEGQCRHGRGHRRRKGDLMAEVLFNVFLLLAVAVGVAAAG